MRDMQVIDQIYNLTNRFLDFIDELADKIVTHSDYAHLFYLHQKVSAHIKELKLTRGFSDYNANPIKIIEQLKHIIGAANEMIEKHKEVIDFKDEAISLLVMLELSEGDFLNE